MCDAHPPPNHGRWSTSGTLGVLVLTPSRLAQVTKRLDFQDYPLLSARIHQMPHSRHVQLRALTSGLLICFTVVGFVAWFPCYQILVALPYYTQTDKYEWSLIAFPLCLFLPSIFSDAFMLMQWPKVRVSF